MVLLWTWWAEIVVAVSITMEGKSTSEEKGGYLRQYILIEEIRNKTEGKINIMFT